jgi:PAS domain S-box-containing protein
MRSAEVSTAASVEEERLQLALDAGQMGTWSYHLASGKQVWDHRQLAIFGLPPNTQPTRELFLSMVLPQDRDRVALGPHDLNPGIRHTSQFRIQRLDGEIRWLSAHSLTRAAPNGDPIEVVGVNWDCTEQKQAEVLAQRNAAQLKLALHAGRMGTWHFDLTSGKQEWDENQYMLFGVDPSIEPTRQVFLALVHPEDIERVGFTDHDLRPGHFHDTHFRIIRPIDGKIRWITARSFARHDTQGKAIERIGVNWDVTEQKLTELDHIQTERRLALATEAADIGVWDWDIGTGAFYYSSRAREIYGFTPDETITYERLRKRTEPEDYRKIEPILGRALDPLVRGREPYRYRIARADTGEQRWLLAHGGAAFSSDGPDAKPLSFTGTLQDITDEIRTQQELKDQQTRLELAISAGDLAVWELNLKTNSIVTSPELNQLYGFSKNATPSLEDFLAVYAPGESDRVQAESAKIVADGGTAIRFEAKHIWADGTVKWISVRAQLLSDNSGAPDRVIGVAMDVTERRLNEERLAVTARELQHRVKNNLAIVQSISVQSFRSARTTEAGLSAFNERLRALGAATDLLTSSNWQHVSVADVVEATLRPYRDDAVDRFAIGGDAMHIPSKDAVSLGMALHELCTNAIKYGALSVETGKVSIQWRRNSQQSVLEWRELGGPRVTPPEGNNGFGMKLLRSQLFDGVPQSVEVAFLSEGLFCRMVLPSGGYDSGSDEPDAPL